MHTSLPPSLRIRVSETTHSIAFPALISISLSVLSHSMAPLISPYIALFNSMDLGVQKKRMV